MYQDFVIHNDTPTDVQSQPTINKAQLLVPKTVQINNDESSALSFWWPEPQKAHIRAKNKTLCGVKVPAQDKRITHRMPYEIICMRCVDVADARFPGVVVLLNSANGVINLHIVLDADA